jgi:hypothetical protein
MVHEELGRDEPQMDGARSLRVTRTGASIAVALRAHAWPNRRLTSHFRNVMRNIKYKPSLPIKPTQKPNGQDLATVAMATLDLTQHSLLSPSAVVTALKCALTVYETSIMAKGFDPDVVAACEKLGTEMAEALLKPKEQPAIVVQESTLVDMDGNPLQIETPAASSAETSEPPAP